MKKIILVFLLLIWMFFIFLFSAQTGIESKALTISGIDTVVSSIPQKEEIDKKKIDIDFLLTPIRKSAHFLEFLILGILSFLLGNIFIKNNKRMWLYAFLFCIFYACTDEIHQLFVTGRCGRVLDVIIDSAGSFTGIMILYLVSKKQGVQNEIV